MRAIKDSDSFLQSPGEVTATLGLKQQEVTPEVALEAPHPVVTGKVGTPRPTAAS